MSSADSIINLTQGAPAHHALLLENYHEVTPDANRHAWSAFHRAIIESDQGERVLKRLKDRYQIRVSPECEEPLLVRHVWAFQAARADLLRNNFPEGRLSRSEISAQTASFALEPEVPIHKLRGGMPSAQLSHFVLPNRLFADRKRLQLYSGIENLEWDAYLERMAKAIISHPLEIGMLIPAPDRNGGRDYYEIIHLGGKAGLEVCALYPVDPDSTLSPLILFQPTQFSGDKQGVATLINDMEPNMGNMGYEASREIIRTIMSDERFRGGKAVLAAYSLGGVHGQRLMKDYPREIARAVFFNDPAPPDRTAVEYAAEVNGNPFWNKEVEIVVYRTVLIDEKGSRYTDWTHAFGGKHVGWGIKNPLVKVRVVELHYLTKKRGLKKRHVKRCLDAGVKAHKVTVVELPKDRVNAALDVAECPGFISCIERVRRWVVCNFIYPLCHFIWSLCQEVLNFMIELLFKNEEKKPPASSQARILWN